MVNKKIKLRLVGLDGNALFLLGAFQKQARKEGWLKDETDEVIKEASSGDYDHLLTTLSHYCEEGGESMFKKLLKEITQRPTDELAHQLDVPFELAQLIQVTLDEEITDTELKGVEEIYKERMR